MKLFIKNKVISLAGSSTVKDEAGNDVFVVKGTLFSISHKKRIKDTEGNLLYKVRNKLMNFITHSAYIYDADGTKVARVKRKFGFRNVYVVEGYQDEITVEGDFLSWTLEVYRNGAMVGTIERYIAWNDAFVLETDTEDDAAFMVALVIAIDNISDERSRNLGS